MSDEQYEYGKRSTEYEEHRALRIGQGRISGYISSFLGVMSLLAVLCFLFPQYLTTPEMRESYNVDWLRTLLKVTMATAAAFGVLTFCLNKRKRMGAIGLLSTGIAYLLGGWHIEVHEVRGGEIALGVDWLILDLLFSGMLFIAIEKLWPKYPEQPILRPDWQLDLFYFALNHLLVALLLIVGNSFAPAAFSWAVNDSFQSSVQSMPLALQILMLVLAADLVQYWVHRSFHEVPFLWKFHSVHHSTEEVDWLSGSRNHIVQTIVDRSLVMVPLFLLGTTKAALDGYVIIAAFQAVFVHANFNWRFRGIRQIVVTPQFHHWHHSRDKPAIDTNYSVHFAFLDRLFGSFHLPGDHWPLEYGTTNPLPHTYVGQLMHPFKKEKPDPDA